MTRQLAAEPRQSLLDEVRHLADVAIFGTLSETYRTCGRETCRCYSGGPKHGPHLHISYRGSDSKTTGYYVPKAAKSPIRAGVAAWNRLQERLRLLADLNAQGVLERARLTSTLPPRTHRTRATAPGRFRRKRVAKAR